jgi:L,D-transpeptidase catalytic domain/Putative peptidoglycan binding domain
MGRTSKIAIVAAVVTLALGASGVYALDTSHEDQITEGVTIAGIDVGGLSREEAERLLRHDLVAPLREPVTVAFEGERYTLPAKRLDLRADVSGMVDAAVDASREGGLPVRVFRYVTGGEVDEEVAPQISHSSKAVERFVRGIADQIDREPRNATVSATGSSLNLVKERAGREMRRDQLVRRIEAAIYSPFSSRLLRPAVVRMEPEVTTNELASEYPTYLTLDRAGFTLHLWEDLKLTESYTVAVGQVGFDTPAGLYHIQNKAVDPAWSVPDWGGSLAGQVIPGGVPENPLKERWLGIYAGAGIHGTDQTYSLGTAASHGCVRMAIPDVIELYDRVPVGTPIYIG